MLTRSLSRLLPPWCSSLQDPEEPTMMAASECCYCWHQGPKQLAAFTNKTWTTATCQQRQVEHPQEIHATATWSGVAHNRRQSSSATTMQTHLCTAPINTVTRKISQLIMLMLYDTPNLVLVGTQYTISSYSALFVLVVVLMPLSSVLTSFIALTIHAVLILSIKYWGVNFLYAQKSLYTPKLLSRGSIVWSSV